MITEPEGGDDDEHFVGRDREWVLMTHHQISRVQLVR